MNRITVGVLASLLLIVACGAPAPSTPSAAGGSTSGTGAASKPSGAAGAPAAASAPQSDAAYRQQVIDGARREGQVNATLHTSWTPEGIARVEEAIEREYG